MDKKVILVVDDAPENIDLLVGLLREKFVVKAARNGEVALKIARRQLPDAILLDIVMPGMDGYQVCEALRNDATTASVPVIFVSGEMGTDDCSRAEQLNAETLAKPVDPEKLMELLDELLQ